jgi:hypothetical protein
MPEEMAPPAPELAVDWVVAAAARARQGQAAWHGCKSSADRINLGALAGWGLAAAGQAVQLAGSAAGRRLGRHRTRGVARGRRAREAEAT